MCIRDSNKEATDLLIRAKESGKSYGGVAECVVENIVAGLGQPVFKKIKSDLGSAILSIGAVNGIEFGDGFLATEKEGSEYHANNINQYGGIQGGITNGNPIKFNVSFQPTSSVLDVAKKGRHDPCIVPRALVVIEAMTWVVLADHLLHKRLDNL